MLSFIRTLAARCPRSAYTTSYRKQASATSRSINASLLTQVDSEPVIALPAKAVPYPAFAEHYFKKRPVVLVGALDLAGWSFDAWVSALTTSSAHSHSPTSCDGGSSADLLLTGKTNTLSQRGNAKVVAGIEAAQAAAHVFGLSGSGNNSSTSNGPHRGSSRSGSDDGARCDNSIGAYRQWRTSLETLGYGQRKGSSRVENDPTGSTLPPCLPLPPLLRTWPGVRVRPDGESAVFATSAGGRTALHQDGFHNCLVHLTGSKNVVLIAPEWGDIHPTLIKALFTTPGTHSTLYGTKAANEPRERSASSTANQSLDSNEGDLHVKYGEDDRLHNGRADDEEWGVGVLGIPRQEVCLAPGDLLYIPEGWWHDVESTTNSVSVALRFDVGVTAPQTLFASAFDL